MCRALLAATVALGLTVDLAGSSHAAPARSTGAALATEVALLPLPCADDRPATATNPAAPAPTIRDIDWCRVDAGLLGVPSDGRFQRGTFTIREYEELGAAHDTTDWTIQGVAYIRLSGLGEIAVVITQRDYYSPDGHRSGWAEAHVLTMRKGKLTDVAELPVGSPVTAIRADKSSISIVSGPDKSIGRHRWNSRAKRFVTQISTK